MNRADDTGIAEIYLQKVSVRDSLAHLYADYREMLGRERPDIVSVCTSARPRAAIGREVTRAGVDV